MIVTLVNNKPELLIVISNGGNLELITKRCSLLRLPWVVYVLPFIFTSTCGFAEAVLFM
jgi:hypothetical protein